MPLARASVRSSASQLEKSVEPKTVAGKNKRMNKRIQRGGNCLACLPAIRELSPVELFFIFKH
jgi:hypothetical protein